MLPVFCTFGILKRISLTNIHNNHKTDNVSNLKNSLQKTLAGKKDYFNKMAKYS